MHKDEFRQIKNYELAVGVTVWLAGKGFLDTAPFQDGFEQAPVCGPFLIDRILFMDHHSRKEARVDLLDPGTGERRSMMRSWLLVPKEVYPWK